MEKLFIEKAEKLKKKGKHPEALEVCYKVLAKNLKSVEAYEEIGDNYLTLEKYDKSEKALKQALKIDKQSANANYLIGFVYSCTGEWKKSVEHLEVTRKQIPNHPELLRCLGWSLYYLGRRNEGIIQLERALCIDPKDPLILNDLGVCYLNQEHFDKASSLFKRSLEIDPQNEKALECMNAVEFFKGKSA